MGLLIARVNWLIKLRWCYAAAALAAGAVLELAGYRYAMVMFALPAAIFAAGNILVRSRLNRVERCGAEEKLQLEFIRALAGSMLASDILVLSALVLCTGGPINPLAAVIVFHLAVASSLLPRRGAYMQAVWASALYGGIAICQSGLLGWRIPVEPPMFQAILSSGPEAAWSLLSAGGVIGMFFLATWFVDAILTRLRKINARLAAANVELEALDLTKSRFLRMSSHQLRSPLAAIHSMLSALQEVGGLSLKQYEMMLKIQTRTDEAMALLDEMMLLSTIKERGIETRSMKAMDVDSLVRSEVDDFADEAANRRLALRLEAHSGCWALAWDDALETVLEHLISNAIKYTPDGGSVFVSTRRRGDGVTIEVKDSGIGIPHGEQDRLFHEFFRATNARQMAGGTGMGLAIVKAIVDQLRGQISIVSGNDGTAVQVTLPATGTAAPGSRLQTSGAAAAAFK